MILTKEEAEKLFELGFKRHDYAEDQYPQDVFECDNALWVMGGRIYPDTTILCDEQVYTKGVWLPSETDLFSWLEEMECQYALVYDGLSYKVEVIDSEGKSYKGKGMYIVKALYKVVSKILMEYGGAPVQKTYEVFEGEVTEEDSH